mmetsp:Transcript_55557/g.109680  ORF Transcript_55557/g.109680 Transcript_55557/m.109680 type:complete len:94 (+) Transcript_55557:710-991(+)
MIFLLWCGMVRACFRYLLFLAALGSFVCICPGSVERKPLHLRKKWRFLLTSEHVSRSDVDVTRNLMWTSCSSVPVIADPLFETFSLWLCEFLP